jgi:predicted Zn-dependent protease with MMP-like domain
MTRDKFLKIVVKAVSDLPDEFQELLENVDIVVEDWPSRDQLDQVGLKDRSELFGLYEGTPLTHRDQGYNLVLPDKITIFQKPLEADCRTEEELKLEITRTVKHEIAHYFGSNEDTLDEIEEGYDT